MRIIKITILLVFTFFTFLNVSFGSSGFLKKTETIRELKDNVDNLNIKSNYLNLQIDETIQNAGELRDFFRNNLTKKELEDLKEIFALYTIYSDRINKVFTTNLEHSKNSEKSKVNLLKEKAGVYKRLTPYIKTKKLSKFLDFIKSDLNTTKEKKDIEEDLYINTSTLSKKVAVIKEKIVEHKKALDEKLEKIIREKVDEKINKLKNSSPFQSLPLKVKKKALNKVINNINSNILELINNSNKVKKKKKELYIIVKTKLEELVESL